MGGQLPLGLTPPPDGALPDSAFEGLNSAEGSARPLSLYLHVPFCSVRCGYCDFNTYTNTELGGGGAKAEYPQWALAEMEMAHRVLGEGGGNRPLHSVFLGGGTPSQMPVADLVSFLERMQQLWGFTPETEVTMEANPDSVTFGMLRALKEAGLTRVSFGMQSAVPHVLAVLDRTHTPERVPEVVGWGKELGLQTSVDLIYGTPGESIEDWERSLREAISYGSDHISAYSLIIEPGTKMAAQMKRGEIPYPSDDEAAAKYELADALLGEAGFHWYEVSNFSRDERTRSLHNLAYWRGSDWWGIGPGAHSHIGGVRFWNAKHPTAYAQRLSAGQTPSVGRELLTPEQRELERVLLQIRIREGLEIASLPAGGRGKIAGFLAEGLIDPPAAFRGRLVLTLRGRLLADALVRTLTEEL